MTAKEQKTYGHAMAKVRDVVVKRNPTLANNMAHYTMGDGKKQFVGLMNDEKFTSEAVKDMESQKTSAWLANTLNIKPKEIHSMENILKINPSKTVNNATDVSVRNTSPQVIRNSSKTKPLDLMDLQKRAYENEAQW
jgi:hypothetical protein